MADRRVYWLAALVVAHHVAVGSLFGLGDAEALYVVYGRHLQGGYIDHPPLVGFVLAAASFALGHSPLAARVPAALLFGATVLLADVAVRRLGGSPRAGLCGAIALLLPPMFFAGTVATTPDVVAAPLCLLALLAAWRALDTGRWPDVLVAGALLGLASLAKVTALLFAPGLVWLAVRRGARVRDLALAGVSALAVLAPVVAWNAAHGAAMLRHRFVWTQQGAGLSLRNVGALVGGQLAYVGPPMLAVFGFVIFDRRLRSRAFEQLRLPAVPALVGAVILGAWSRVAEPHWTATALLPLVIGVGLAADMPLWTERRMRQLRRAAVGWAVFAALVMHVLVLTPLLPLVTPDRLYQPRGDLANELHGWPAVGRAVARALRPGERAAAGHYTMCAQLEVALGPEANVSCLTEEMDDWDLWGRGQLDADIEVFVADQHFPRPPAGAKLLRSVEVHRGGRPVRTFALYRLDP